MSDLIDGFRGVEKAVALGPLCHANHWWGRESGRKLEGQQQAAKDPATNWEPQQMTTPHTHFLASLLSLKKSYEGLATLL